MAAKVLYIDDLLTPDAMGCTISNNYMTWEVSRQTKVAEWNEIQSYLFATDTTKTTNAKQPWSNKTTIPKLCQIRDNLHANYMATLFPKRKWLSWVGSTKSDEIKAKKEAIETYMQWVVDRSDFYNTVSQLVYDYIDYGNPFATVRWQDETSKSSIEKTGYMGPMIQRISPLDIVFNPTAPTFSEAPKIIRSVVSLGEIMQTLDQTTGTDEDINTAKSLKAYLLGYREQIRNHIGGENWEVRDAAYNIAGFSSFRDYLTSGYIEVLTFYGDYFNEATGEFKKNQVIKVVDRHKVIYMEDNETIFGSAPIFHTGWRTRPDNLWAMGPLDNLVGLQYRMDHLENMKADAVDMSTMPMFKIKGVVEEFDWEPLGRIYIGDDGDVSLLHPASQTMDIKSDIAILQQTMEEMAGAPREAMGFRTPGEKTVYEVQSMQNSASRIFQSKTAQFERNFLENILNAMLELARRKLDTAVVRMVDDEFNMGVFFELTNEDISGQGRIRPIAARNFAEKSQMVQNLSSFFGSSIGADPEVKRHFSSFKLAKLFEDILDIREWETVQENIRLSEQTNAQRLSNANEEQLAVETQTPTGFLPGDYDAE